MLDFFILVLSFCSLVGGAELSLHASEKVGKRLGMSPLMIGLLLIGLGTSLPEFFVGHVAMNKGAVSLAIGNIVGSNLANLLLILGITSFWLPLSLKGTHQQIIYHFVLSLFLFVALLFFPFGLGLAFILFGFSLVYTLHMTFAIKNSAIPKEKNEPFLKSMIYLISGLLLLYFGGEFIVRSTLNLGIQFGINEYILSSILVAFGTSFPELVTSLMACYRKKDTELIIGNILGSNIFNGAFILGSLALYQTKIPIAPKFELSILLLGGFLLLVIHYFGKSFNKKWGTLFLLLYALVIKYWIQLSKTIS